MELYVYSKLKSQIHNTGKVCWLCFTSHRQRGHLETVPPFTVHCEGREARFYTVPTGNRTPGRRVAVHNTTAAPRKLHYW